MKHARLYLTSDELQVWPARPPATAPLAVFLATPAGLAEFRRFLAAHPAWQFSCLIDLPTESLEAVAVPGLRGRDRTAFRQRTLEERFPGHRLYTAQASTAPATELLLHGYSDELALQPWLAALIEAAARMTHIQGTAPCGPLLYRRAGGQASHVLLALLEGLRLRAWLLSGQVCRFTRLVALRPDTPAAMSRQCADELERCARYLALPPDTDCLLLAEHPLLNELRLTLPAGYRLQAHDDLRTPADATPCLLRLPVAPRDRQFPAPALRQALRFERERHHLGILTLFAVTLCLGHALFRQGQIATLERERQALEVQHDFLLQRVAQEGLVGDTPTTESLQALHASYHTLPAWTPDDALRRLAQVLEAHPALQLERIDWKMTAPEASTAGPAEETLRLHFSSGTSALAHQLLPTSLRTAFGTLRLPASSTQPIEVIRHVLPSP